MTRRTLSLTIVLSGLCAAGLFAQAGGGSPGPQEESLAGPLAHSCGVPTAPLPDQAPRQAVFPPGQYPVSLPAVSLLGARNDLPNPYGVGTDWGQLPPGRKWGSTASVTTAPDGTIWVVDSLRQLWSGRHDMRRSERERQSRLSVRHLRQAAEDVRRRPVRQPSQTHRRQGREPMGRGQRRPPGLQAGSERPRAADPRQEGCRRTRAR